MSQTLQFLGLTAFMLAFSCFGSFVLGTPPARRTDRLFLFFSELFFSLFVALGGTYGLGALLRWNALITLGCLLLGGALLWPIRGELRAVARLKNQNQSILGPGPKAG